MPGSECAVPVRSSSIRGVSSRGKSTSSCWTALGGNPLSDVLRRAGAGDGVVPRFVPENVTVTVTGDDGVAAMVPSNEMTNLRVMPNNHMVYPWDKDVVKLSHAAPLQKFVVV